jgi:hypothetical protein
LFGKAEITRKISQKLKNMNDTALKHNPAADGGQLVVDQ